MSLVKIKMVLGGRLRSLPCGRPVKNMCVPVPVKYRWSTIFLQRAEK